MGLTRTVAPAAEPLTVREVERHVKLDESMVEPVPDAPTVARVSPAAAGDLSVGVYRYRVTFVTADGETDGGALSGTVTIMDPATNGQVAVTAIPLGGAAVTARRLYRTVADGSAYLLVATIADNSTTSYTDTIADDALGAGIPVANTTGDPEFLAFIETARVYVEEETRRALLTQTWRLTRDAFPTGDEADPTIRLARPPVQSVASITYVDPLGETQTLDPATYVLDAAATPPRIHLAYDAEWPSTRAQRNAVTILFVAGYGDTPAAVPAPLRAAMKLMIGHWFANREAVNIGNITSELPLAVANLLGPYRCPEAA
jgi:uncharacterized phiE125 gp8 family phage protein